MRIKKISPTTPANGNIENSYGTSQTNAYSEAYANTTFATKDVATTSANGLMSASDKNLLNKITYTSATSVVTNHSFNTNGINSSLLFISARGMSLLTFGNDGTGNFIANQNLISGSDIVTNLTKTGTQTFTFTLARYVDYMTIQVGSGTLT